MRVGVIGAGLGGLLTAASLLKLGCDVEIFEKLPYPGGRFTNLEYKGYQLSTGALHMIPHGERGPLGGMMRSLKAKFEVVPSEPFGFIRIDGKNYSHKEVPEILPSKEKLRLGAVLAMMRVSKGDSKSFEAWLRGKVNHPLIYQIADSFSIWALSMRASQVSSREYIAIGRSIEKYGGPGIPRGGCKGVTDALVEIIEADGGAITCKTKVDEIIEENGVAKGIRAKGQTNMLDIVVSDTGPKATAKLLGGKKSSTKLDVLEAAGIKISIACDKPMLGHTGVLFTPQAQRIGGLNEVSNADPSLAPPGKHLLMSHQAWDTSKDVKEEVSVGMKDLHKIFPDFDDHCEVLMTQSYRGEWPVNRAQSGLHLDFTGPIKGLFYVGDAVKPEGLMETEGVAAGVKLVVAAIKGM